MKIKAILILALTTVAIKLPTAVQGAFPPPPPAANPLVDVIVEISPSVAMVGQTIVVRTAHAGLLQISPALLGSLPQRSIQGLPISQPPSPALAAPAPKIWFANSFGQQWVLGNHVSSLGNGRYSVVVPQGAHSGALRFETLLGSSYSTPRLTIVSAGFSVVNFSQFNVVSIKVDNVEKLTPGTVPASLPSDPNVFHADIGAAAGNHSMQLTLGPSASQPVIVYSLPSVAATIPADVIQVGIVSAGEYLVASPNRTTRGNSVIASWQTQVVLPDASIGTNGLDFTQTGTGTTWAHWVGDRSNVVATGPITEPTNWPLNPTNLILDLRRSNGAHYTYITINLLNKTFLADDGNTYELQ